MRLALERSRGGAWLYKRISRLIISFTLAFFIYVVVGVIIKDPLISSYSLSNLAAYFITLTIPPFTTWYLKTQFVLYFFHFLMRKIFKDEKKRNIAIMLALCVYTIILVLFNVADYWWTSIICYGIGVIMSKYKVLGTKVLSKRSTLIILGLVVTVSYLCTFKVFNLTIVLCISTVLFIMALLFQVRIKSTILNFIGKFSFELYLTQILLVHFILQRNYFKGNTNIEMIIYLFGSIVLGYSVFVIYNAISDRIAKVKQRSFE